MVYPFSKIFLGGIIRLFTGKVIGRENLIHPPFIVAANHSSYADDLLLPYNIAVITDNKFNIFVNSRFYKNYFLKKFLDHFECIPVDVSKDVKDEERKRKTNELAFEKAINSLKAGKIFMIFPEGGRSEDGKLKKAKVGVAKLALGARLPVIPVGIVGSYQIMPKGAKFPQFKKANIIIGKPLHFDAYYEKEKDYKVLEQVTTVIMKEIAKLINQEYKY